MRPKSTSEIRSTGSRTRLLAGSSFLAVIEHASFGRMSVIGRDLLHGRGLLRKGGLPEERHYVLIGWSEPSGEICAKVFGAIERAECSINR